MKNLTKWSHLLSNHFTLSIILLCRTLYCVQRYTVSNTLLCPAYYCVQQNTCPHLPKGSFVHLLHINKLRSYYTGLANQQSFSRLKLLSQLKWCCMSSLLITFHHFCISYQSDCGGTVRLSQTVDTIVNLYKFLFVRK